MSKKKSAGIVIIVALIVVLVAITVSIFQQNSSIEKQISALKEAHCTISGGIKVYETFTVNDYEISLYSEPTMTAEEALETYPNAYALCAEVAEERGIEASFDNPDFLTFAKSFAAQNESGTDELIQECKDLATFIDYYENIELNDTILRGAITDDPDVDIFELMPEKQKDSTERN
ncbi:MAG: hypothetical protein LUF29_06370 [Oscillospiraceae bacterium]|nr:hypothetical protein [Oscillospiraceae bacterium]